MWFPKEQSNPITNMVCELNNYLGGKYFTVMLESGSSGCLYSLCLTNYGASRKKYRYLATQSPMYYEVMFNYLQGILLGYRAAHTKN